jgi:hypothetical protein
MNMRNKLLEPIFSFLDSFGSPLDVPFSIWFMGIGSLILLVTGFAKAKKYRNIDEKPHGGTAMLIGVIGLIGAISVLLFYNKKGGW